ncbi:MBL fold metallo-hydrolase [Gordonia humi]|uniref:MBL fold metallo-hydrolase n=1 Tax=Gordonia humi TaxID=686429 RepID=UPI00360B2CFC
MTQQITVSDEYTGNVSPDGDDQQNKAQRRDLDNATVVKLSVGPMDNNVYVVTDKATGDALLIDAANDAGVLLDLAEQIPGTVKQIVTTHGHFDHWQALDEVSTGLAVPPRRGDRRCGRPPGDRRPAPVRRRHRGRRRADARRDRHRRPHARLRGPGPHRAVRSRPPLHRRHPFFPGGVGKTWQPGDFEILLGDVETKFFGRYGDDTVVYPGHGKDTTLGAERPGLPEWRARGW